MRITAKICAVAVGKADGDSMSRRLNASVCGQLRASRVITHAGATFERRAYYFATLARRLNVVPIISAGFAGITKRPTSIQKGPSRLPTNQPPSASKLVVWLFKIKIKKPMMHENHRYNLCCGCRQSRRG